MMMIARSIWVAAWLGVSLACGLGCAQVYSEQKSESIYARNIIIPAQELSLSRAEEESRKFLAGTSDRLRLRILRVSTQPQDASMINAATPTDVSFEWYVKAYRRIRQSVGTIAELTATPKGAVLRCRNPRGLPERVLLRGQDPLVGSLNGIAWEILYIAVREGPRLPIFGRQGGMRADTYIRTQRQPTESSGRLLHKRMIADFEAPLSFTHVRKDELFSGEYPLVFPFSAAENPPTKQRTPTLVCDSWNASKTATCQFVP